ncbi:OB-fold protein [Dryocola sp. BD613]|uniref:OB-fold protein n=1 Tax=Dryocola sp. BD613 TaxID=3133272 RepID=UPI003F50294B
MLYPNSYCEGSTVLNKNLNIIYTAMEADLKRILALILGVNFYGCVFADTTTGSDLNTNGAQLDKEQIAAYVGKLVTSGCEQAMNDGSIDDAIDDATQGMKKKSDSYAEIHDSIVLGSRIGSWFKENGWGPMKNGVRINNCAELGSYFLKQGELIDGSIQELMSEPSQLAIAFKNASVYQTTAKSLITLYRENEIAADDKIAGRKVGITGVIQGIRKDFKGDVVIEFQTGNQFMPVRLSMDDGERTKAAKLKKGQKTTITCDKMMLLVGSPSGSNCKID